MATRTKTEMINIEELKYPIGEFSIPEEISRSHLEMAIDQIEIFPSLIIGAVSHLSERQLDTPYRPQGWTVRQVVHHCADSHMNSLMRYKLALTEDNPDIKAYNEALWAELPDSKNLELAPSIDMLKGIHKRWTVLLKSLSNKQFQRTFFHPVNDRKMTLRQATAMYAWHCNHHLNHILKLKERENWD